jgi:hypothetical protein
LAGSIFVSTHAPLHGEYPDRQLFTQPPAVQIAVSPAAAVHGVLHAPHAEPVGPSRRFTTQPFVAPHVAKPGSQTRPHVPFVHDAVP